MKRFTMTNLITLLMAITCLLAVSTALAQDSGDYHLSWWTVDGGGGTSSGGSYGLSGTAGQLDAGMLSGSTYTVTGGFWAGVAGPTSPVLIISKMDEPDSVSAGDLLTYTIVVQNTGVADAMGVTITDTIPAHTAFVSADSGGMPVGTQTMPPGTNPPENEVWWTGKTIPTGDSLMVTLVVRVANPLPSGATITNDNYGVTSAEGESARGSLVTTAVEPVPVLSISKTDEPDPVAAGGLLTYTIVVQNIGDADATNVTITDTIPTSTTFVSADSGGALVGDQVQWTGKTVSATGSLTVTFSVQVNGPPDGPPIVNWYYGVRCVEVPTPVMGAPVTTWRSQPSQPSHPSTPPMLPRAPGHANLPTLRTGPRRTDEGTYR